MPIDMHSKDKSAALMLTVAGVELSIFIVFFILDIYFDIPLLSEGRIVHYSLLFFYMIFLWGGLENGRLSQSRQLVIFAIIPLLEFSLINIIGVNNMLGTLFLTIYFVIVSLYLEIDTFDEDSPSHGRYIKKVIKSWLKGLTK